MTFSRSLGTLQQPGLLLSANLEPEQMSGDTVLTNRKAGIGSWYYPLLFDLTFKTALFYAVFSECAGKIISFMLFSVNVLAKSRPGKLALYI